jgi:DNA-binding PucR family transcriptional regulator
VIERAGLRVAGVHELGAHRLLLDLLPPDTVRSFADAVLAPLREHGPLLAAVRTFLRHDGQYAAAARALADRLAADRLAADRLAADRLAQPGESLKK